MAVTIVIGEVEPETCKLPVFKTLNNFLAVSCRTEWRQSEELVRTSFSEADLAHVRPQRNGFVDTVIEAYNKHHRLVIRPDDVWIAIVSQLSFYVEAHAEELRSRFVTHSGKESILLTTVGTRYTVDYGWLADQFCKCLDEKIVDDTLREWLLPRFSTTTDADRTVMAVQMMSTMKSYFNFGAHLMCGIPSVTLEGARSDWEDLLSRLPKLSTFGPECAHWADLLLPLLERFVDAFNGNPDVELWNRVAHVDHVFSGTSYISGWITAFCPFSTSGKWIDSTCAPRANLLSAAPRSIQSDDDVEKLEPAWRRRERERKGLVLDGRSYPLLDLAAVPAGYCTVDLDLNDNGELFNAMLVAGHFGCRVLGDKGDGIQPAPGWFMCIKGQMKKEIWDERYGLRS